MLYVATAGNVVFEASAVAVAPGVTDVVLDERGSAVLWLPPHPEKVAVNRNSRSHSAGDLNNFKTMILLSEERLPLDTR